MADDDTDGGSAHDRSEATDRHGWGAALDDLGRRREVSQSMGGDAKLARQRERGRLNARERVERLLDKGSFTELGGLVATADGRDEPPAPADALVAGMGRIDDRPVLVGAEDFTVMGGSIGIGAASKRFRLTQLAARERVPLVMMLEGAGHRLTNALESHGRSPNDLQGLAELAGLVPTVCIVMGASAGHSALTAPLMDFVVMVEGASLFSAGPPLVEAAIGEKIEKEDLGGTAIHVRTSGVAHNAASDDDAALSMARRYLSYFPLNAWQHPPRIESSAAERRVVEEMLSLVPRNGRTPYRMRKVLRAVMDEDSVFEVQPEYGASILTALARIGGRSVAVVANEPFVRAGAIDTQAADKATHFLEVAGAFHLPVIFLADNPGVQAGSAAERAGALRAAARMFAAQHRLRVPKLHVTLRKAFGFGSSVMAMNPFDDQTLTLAFPGATLGAMPATGGGAAAKVDAATQAALDAAELDASYRSASSLAYDDVIDPRELRDRLIDGLELAEGRRVAEPGPIGRVGPLP